MKRNTGISILLLGAGLALILMAAGCGAGSPDPGSTANVSGIWDFTLQTQALGAAPTSIQMSLLQKVDGTVSGPGITGTETFDITGAVSGFSVSLTGTGTGGFSWTFTGTATGDSMTGNWTDSNGGSGVSSGARRAPEVDVTGTWDSVTNPGGITSVSDYVQTGGQLTGTCVSGETTFNVSGIVSGRWMTTTGVNVSSNYKWWTFEGIVNSKGDKATGTFFDYEGGAGTATSTKR